MNPFYLLLIGFISTCVFGAVWHLVNHFEQSYRRPTRR
jgi:hypothetical protein